MSKMLGEEHVRRLRGHLDALRATGLRVSNATEVATACGFDRGVLYKNPRCRELWEEHVRIAGDASAPAERVISRQSEQQSRRIRELEQKNADLEEKLREAHAEVSRLRIFEMAYDHTASTGRDIML